MRTFETVRLNIRNNRLEEAITLLTGTTHDRETQDDLILLNTRLTRCFSSSHRGTADPELELNRITWGLLRLTSQIEKEHGQQSQRLRLTSALEKQVEDSYECLIRLNKHHSEVGDVLTHFRLSDPDLYKIAVALDGTQGSKRQHALLYLQSEIADGQSWSEQDKKLLIEMLESHPEAFHRWEQKEQKKQAIEDRLETRIEKLQMKYNRLRNAGIAGITLALLANYFSDALSHLFEAQSDNQDVQEILSVQP